MTELETKLLGALKQCDEAMSYMSEYDIPIMLPTTVKQAIAAAEAAQQVSDIDVVELTKKSYMDGGNAGIEAERNRADKLAEDYQAVTLALKANKAMLSAAQQTEGEA